MKRLFITISFIAITITNVLAADNYNFSAICSSGQTLYYKIISSVEPFTVKVTYPDYTNSSYYYNYTRPSGGLTIPETVVYNGNIYSVISIDNYAFYNCTSLTSINIPNSVKSIGNYSFYGCVGLKSIVIPSSVASIGDYAFKSCSNVNEFVFEGEVPPVFGTNVFDYTPSG